MKKVFTLFAAVGLMASVSFAQTAHRHVPMTKFETNTPTLRTLGVNASADVKAPGDTVSTFPWTEGFESTTMTGFSFLDADNDGNGWEVKTVSGDNFSTHSGDGVIVSASYDNDLGAALTPDNWMILPAFELPADASEFNLTWFEKGQDADWADEYYSVYISTTGNGVSDFTTAVMSSTATGDWVKKTVSLASYGGQTVFIAFRHHNVTDMFFLNIDDIRIGGPEPPEVAVTGPSSVMLGAPATFTATGASSFTWEVDGVTDTETGDVLTYTFTTTGNHTVVASATNSAGTGSATLNVLVYSCDNITVFPHVWSFEDESDVNCLTIVDGDNDGQNWYYSYTEGSGYGHNSDGLITSASYANNTALTPDNWLILPAIELPTGSEYILSWYAKAQDADWADEYYSVYITTTGSDTTDFTATTAVFSDLSTGNWTKHSIDLSSYAGQTVYVAFRHYNCTDMFRLNIDDIRVGSLEAPDLAVEGPEEIIVGEAYEWTATSDVTSLVWSVDGTTVGETGTTLSYTFTTAGSHTIEVSATNAAGTSSANITVNAVQCDAQQLPYAPDLANDINLCWDNQGWSTIDMEGVPCIYSMSNLYGLFDLDPDNWIYTPYLTMPAEGNYEIAWKVMPYEPQLPSDHYGVYVVKDGNATLLYEETLSANIGHFSQRSVTIPDNITGDFKVAFRHYETTGGYVILISDIQVVADGTTVGISGANEANVNVYPNPASSMLRVEGEGIQQVEIIDVNGRVVMNAKGGSINVDNLAAGVYMVRVVTNDGVSTKKIVKK